MPISGSEGRVGQSGFTLLEVLLLMALLSLGLLVIGTLTQRGQGEATLKELQRQAVGMLYAARIDAMETGKARRLVIDPKSAALWLQASDERLDLGGNVKLSVSYAREASASEEGAIIFFPNGTSTGATLALGLDGRQALIDVHWLTGSIHAR